MVDKMPTHWEDVGLVSLLRSPFLFPSLLLHAIFFLLAMHAATLSIKKPENVTPISVQLWEGRESGADIKSIGPAKGAGGPRAAPKLGTPVAPVERTGKLDTGSLESPAPASSAEPAPMTKPAPLPGPKALAASAQRESVNVNETSPDSLVRLPTKETATHFPASVASDLETSRKNLAALKGVSEGSGIKALKEGAEVPGALKGTGNSLGPHGVPGGSKSGTGMAGGGTGMGTGGGSVTGLGSDYSQYLKQLEKRVHSVWKYPENVTGMQKVAVRFILDKAGKLIQAEVVESSDARLNASALEAMKRASPFPPIPVSLKDLVNEPLIIRFSVSIRVRG